MRYRIARDGKEISEQDQDSVILDLKSGVLLPTDYYWDGVQWALLSELQRIVAAQDKIKVQQAFALKQAAQRAADAKQSAQRAAEATQSAQRTSEAAKSAQNQQAAKPTPVTEDIELNRLRWAPRTTMYFVQGLTVLIVLLMIGLYLFLDNLRHLGEDQLAELKFQTTELRQLNSRQWQYISFRVLTSQISDRRGSDAFKYSSIDDTKLDQQLSAAGLEGWEVVSVALEMETAWPNFGKDDYVTGLQPNMRPQSLLVILRRPKR